MSRDIHLVLNDTISLASIDPIDTIAIFLRLDELFQCLDKAWLSQEPDIEVIQTQTVVGDTDSLIEILVQKCLSTSDIKVVSTTLWILVRLCRRRLDKSTIHANNLEKISKFAVDILKNSSAIAKTSNDIAHPLCYLIMILASDNEENQLALCHEGKADEVIAHTLITFPDNNTTLQFALRAVRNLAAHDENSGPLVQAGVCEALVIILKTCCTTVEQRGTNLTSNANDATSREEKTSIMHLMDCALWAIVNLVCDDSTGIIYGAAGGVDALVGTLATVLQSSVSSAQLTEREGVIRTALQAMRNLTSSTRSLMHYARGLPLSIAVLDPYRTDRYSSAPQYSHESKIPDAALWCLAAFLGDANMGRQILDEGGYCVITSCVTAVHAQDLSTTALMIDATRDLECSNQSDDQSTSILPEPKVSLRDVRHSFTGPVAEAGLWCLRNLAAAIGSSGRVQLALDKGLALCYALLQEYLHRDGMAALCCEVLLCLIAGEEYEDEPHGDADAAKPKAKTITPPNLRVLDQLTVIHTQSSLFSNSSNEPPLLELLCSVLSHHQAEVEAVRGEDDDLQQPVLKLMLALVKYTSACSSDPYVGDDQELVSSGGSSLNSIVKVVTKAMECHSTDAMVARIGCEIIAAVHYQIYHASSNAETTRAAPLPTGPGADVLLSRGLLKENNVLLGGKTMGAVLHAWLPRVYPPPPPIEEEESTDAATSTT